MMKSINQTPYSGTTYVPKKRYHSVDQTQGKHRLDNISFCNYYDFDGNTQSPITTTSTRGNKLDDILSSQKLRWAKKGSLKVSYLEDPSYNSVHNEMTSTSYQVSRLHDQGDDQSIFEESKYLQQQQQQQKKGQAWSNNYIKTLLKQKEKQEQELTSQQFYNLITIKEQNEKNLHKVKDPPKYKLYQTSVQKRNLPPVKLKHLKYLQYFEEKKKNFPHLHQPLNSIVLKNPSEIMQEVFQFENNSVQDHRNSQEEIRNHVYQQPIIEYQNKNNQFENHETPAKKREENELSYIKEAINNLENNVQNQLVQKSSYKSFQDDILNKSPVRKLPRVFGSRNNSPKHHELSKTPPQYSKHYRQKVELESIKIDDSFQQKQNFYTHNINHLDQSYHFSIKSSQVTPNNKKINTTYNHNDTLSHKKQGYSEQIPQIKLKQENVSTTNQSTRQKKFDFVITSQIPSQTQRVQNNSFMSGNNYDTNSIFISR